MLGFGEVFVHSSPGLVGTSGIVVIKDRVDIIALHGRGVLELVDRGKTHHKHEESKGEGKDDKDSDADENAAHDDFFLGGVTVFPKNVSGFSSTGQHELATEKFFCLLQARGQPSRIHGLPGQRREGSSKRRVQRPLEFQK